MNWERETLQKISHLGFDDLKLKESVAQIDTEEINQIFAQLLNTYNERDVVSDPSDIKQIAR
jgi:hypothetical protein